MANYRKLENKLFNYVYLLCVVITEIMLLYNVPTSN